MFFQQCTLCDAMVPKPKWDQFMTIGVLPPDSMAATLTNLLLVAGTYASPDRHARLEREYAIFEELDDTEKRAVQICPDCIRILTRPGSGDTIRRTWLADALVARLIKYAPATTTDTPKENTNNV